MARSVQIHPEQKEQAVLALERAGFLTQGDLAANLGLALSTVNNFFNSKFVSVAKFEQICEALDLDKQAIRQPVAAKVITTSTPPQPETSPQPVDLSTQLSAYDPETFTGREELIDELLEKLQGQQRLVWITGLSGIGKTTLGECLVSWAWEEKPNFQWVYLEIVEGQNPDFGSVAAELWSKLGEAELEPQIRNNPEQVVKKLVQKLQAHPYWIQIDALERLLNPEKPTGFEDAYWVTFFQSCLQGSQFLSRLVLTSQALPMALVEFSDRYPNCWSQHQLQGLLEVDQQLEFFQRRGLSIAPAKRAILTQIARTYEGHPLVMKVIAEDIVRNFGKNVDRYWQAHRAEFEQVARELQGVRVDEMEYNEALDRRVRERIKESLSKLPTQALELLRRSSVFRRPVPKKFWLGMMGNCTPQEQKAAYRDLDDRALIEKEGTEIRQHNLIRAVAYDLLRENPSTWETTECQAADLWLTAYKPADDVPNLEKVRGYLEAIDHYCEVEDWEKTKELFTQEINTDNQSTLSRQLDIWGYYQEEISLCKKLLDKCGHEIDVKCWKDIGNGYIDLGNYSETIKAYENSLKIARKIGDRRGEGNALGNLGLAYNSLGQYDQAIDFHQQHLTIAREIGDRRGEGNALGNLGNAYDSLGQYDQAIDFLQQCLTIVREIGDRRGEGNALGNLGNAYDSLGQYDQAIDFHQQALTIAREIGNRWGEGNALGNLGNAYDSLGQYDRAIDFHQQALIISREIGDRQGEGIALGSLGNAYDSLGQHDRSSDFHQQLLTIAREIGDRRGEGAALGNLGNAYYSLGQYDRAIDFYQQRLTIAREIGDRQGEGIALVNTGETQIKLAQYPESLKNNQAALKIFREIGFREGVAEALKNLAELHQALGDLDLARQYCHQALTLATELGIPLATECETLLLEIDSGRKGE